MPEAGQAYRLTLTAIEDLTPARRENRAVQQLERQAIEGIERTSIESDESPTVGGS